MNSFRMRCSYDCALLFILAKCKTISLSCTSKTSNLCQWNKSQSFARSEPLLSLFEEILREVRFCHR